MPAFFFAGEAACRVSPRVAPVGRWPVVWSSKMPGNQTISMRFP